MSIESLQPLFKPNSVALIGASNRPNSIGSVVIKNLLQSGFHGCIMPVNPKSPSIEGVLCYKDINSLPMTPDLAIFCIPAAGVASVLAQLGERGTKAAVIISAGFGSGEGEDGLRRRKEVIEVAKQYGIRLIGPNCVGLLIPSIGLNASFAHVTPDRGDIGFVSQSGAVVTAVLDWAKSKHIGFTHVLSMGDMVDFDFGEAIEYLTKDPETKTIILYIEAITNARSFIAAARAAALVKPVIVLKTGRSEEGAKAAASHTGSLAGSDEVYDAVFQRCGLLRVYDMNELFDTMETLARTQELWGDRLCILTNGGGIGVLATDKLIELGGKLAQLQDKTIARLNEVLPTTWSHGNPVDIIGDAPGERYANAFRIIMEDTNVDAILVLNCPVAIVPSIEPAEAILNVYQASNRHPKPILIAAWLGEETPAEEARRLFAVNDIPSYSTPGSAISGFKRMVEYYYNRKKSLVSQAEHQRFHYQVAHDILQKAIANKQEWLTEIEAKNILRAYNIPIVETFEVESPEDAYKSAKKLKSKMVLKILSPDITHKSDSGGVILDLASPEEVRDAAQKMLERYKISDPKANIQGFALQEMIERPKAHELILGVSEDSVFGPVMLFGSGGKAVEMVKDNSLALPPLTMELATELIMRTKIYNLLKGYRDEKPADIPAIAQCLVNLSQLVIDLPLVKELDINPLLADHQGVIALDARIKVNLGVANYNRLAISPYPHHLIKKIKISGYDDLILRPVKSKDSVALTNALNLIKSSNYSQLLSSLPYEAHLVSTRLSQIDYDREMVFVIENKTHADEILGVARVRKITSGKDMTLECMFDVIPEFYSNASLLLEYVIEYAHSTKIKTLFTDVLHPMFHEHYIKAGFKETAYSKKGTNRLVYEL